MEGIPLAIHVVRTHPIRRGEGPIRGVHLCRSLLHPLFQSDGPGKEDVVLQVDVAVQVLLELVQVVERGAVGRASIGR